MNKAELINVLADRLGSNRKATGHALDAILDTIYRTVSKGEKVTITGFGTFEKVQRAARTGRNPATGESIKVKKSTAPKFRPGQEFKNVVSGQKKLGRLAKTTSAAAGSRTAKGTGTGAAAAAKTAASSARAGKTTAKAAAATSGAAAKSTAANRTGSKSATSKSAAAKKLSTSSSGAAKSAAAKTMASSGSTTKAASKKSSTTTTAGRSPARRTAKQ